MVRTEDEMVGWYHQFNGHELGQTPGDSEGQGSMVCCSPWGYKESDMTSQLNNNNLQFQGPLVPISLRSILGIVIVHVLGTV